MFSRPTKLAYPNRQPRFTSSAYHQPRQDGHGMLVSTQNVARSSPLSLLLHLGRLSELLDSLSLIDKLRSFDSSDTSITTRLKGIFISWSERPAYRNGRDCNHLSLASEAGNKI